MREQVVCVLEPFPSFMRSFNLACVHNMLTLMLDPRYKDLFLVGSYFSRNMATYIVEEYDEKMLLLLLMSEYWKNHTSIDLASISDVNNDVFADSTAVFGVGVSQEDKSFENVRSP